MSNNIRDIYVNSQTKEKNQVIQKVPLRKIWKIEKAQQFS